MDINRNNYEGFFLLYVDGELSMAEKKAVEAFVRQNPDLQGELQLLQQTVLQPETLAFAHKSDLHKNTEVFQKQLLLYLDNELASADAQALEQQLSVNNNLQQEWAILQQTKLADEHIPFENKSVLYRREPARIIVAKWWRIAAAALLLGFGVWGGVALMNNDNGSNGSGGSVATVNGADTKSDLHNHNNNTSTNNITTTEADNNDQNDADPVVDPTSDNHANMAITTPAKATLQTQTIPARTAQDPNNVAGQNNLDRMSNKNKVDKGVLENFNTDNRNEIAVNNVTPIDNELEPVVSTPVERIKVDDRTNADKTLKSNAAEYAVNDMKAVGATDSYLAPSSKKNRRSGLFRKVTRFFQRSINNRGEGDGLKIAGFEFAMK